MHSFKLIQVNVIYTCNRDCSYCYAKDLKEDYEKNMSLEDFKSLLEWFGKNNIKSINITGGEPTIHPLIGDMLALAKKKKLEVTVFTNGLFPKTFLKHINKADSFLINYNNKDTYTNEEYTLLHKNLGLVKQKKKSLILAFNITKGIKSCDHIIKAAKKYRAIKVNMDLIVPNSLKNNEHVSKEEFKKNKTLISKFLKEFKKNKVEVKITRPMPFCIFKDEIEAYKGVFYSNCSAGYGIVAVNPDLTIFPCLSIFFKGPKITSFKGLQDIRSYYHNAIHDLKWKRYFYPECETCIYFIRKKCQGSCLCHKCTEFSMINKQEYTIFSQYNKKELKEFINQADKAIGNLNSIFEKPKKKLKIYLFNNKKDMLYYSGVYHYPKWVRGFTSKNIYYQFLKHPSKRLIHELCHLYVYQNKNNEIPLWLEEGFCEYVTYRGEEDLRLKLLTKNKKLIPFKKLFLRTRRGLLKYDHNPLDSNLAYAQSHSLVKHLVNKFGLSIIMELLKGNYKDFKQHFKKLTNYNFQEIEQVWLKVNQKL